MSGVDDQDRTVDATVVCDDVGNLWVRWSQSGARRLYVYAAGFRGDWAFSTATAGAAPGPQDGAQYVGHLVPGEPVHGLVWDEEHLADGPLVEAAAPVRRHAPALTTKGMPRAIVGTIFPPTLPSGDPPLIDHYEVEVMTWGTQPPLSPLAAIQVKPGTGARLTYRIESSMLAAATGTRLRGNTHYVVRAVPVTSALPAEADGSLVSPRGVPAYETAYVPFPRYATTPATRRRLRRTTAAKQQRGERRVAFLRRVTGDRFAGASFGGDGNPGDVFVMVKDLTGEEARALEARCGTSIKVTLRPARYSLPELLTVQETLRNAAQARPDGHDLSATGVDIEANRVRISVRPGNTDLATALIASAPPDSITVRYETVFLTR